MSLTGILDLDREILRYVEDLQLLKVCSINKKMWDSVRNEAFLRRRLGKYVGIEKYRKEESLTRFFSKIAYYLEQMRKKHDFEYTDGDFEKQWDLLEKYKENILLIQACGQGELSLVKYCLKKGCDVSTVSTDHEAPLISAIYSRQFRIVKFLVENGADIHTWREWPFTYSVENGYLEILQYCVEKGVDIHLKNEHALRWAARNGYLEMVKWLVEQGCDIHIQQDYPLRLASKQGHIDAVKFLIHSGANIHAKKNSALNQATKRGFSEIVEILQISRN